MKFETPLEAARDEFEKRKFDQDNPDIDFLLSYICLLNSEIADLETMLDNAFEESLEKN